MVIGQPGTPWKPSEVETALEAYFAMMRLHIDGEAFNKSEIRSEIADKLPTRTESSIEMKWGNVGAVLDERGLTWLQGCTPLGNYQASPPDAVERWLEADPELHRAIDEGRV